MKLADLLRNAPESINGFNRVECCCLEDYSFILDSEEENEFNESIEIDSDDNQLLWYERHDKAYCLFVTIGSGNNFQREFVIREMDFLWEDEGIKEYDNVDDTFLDVTDFDEAIVTFIEFLK